MFIDRHFLELAAITGAPVAYERIFGDGAFSGHTRAFELISQYKGQLNPEFIHEIHKCYMVESNAYGESGTPRDSNVGRGRTLRSDGSIGPVDLTDRQLIGLIRNPLTAPDVPDVANHPRRASAVHILGSYKRGLVSNVVSVDINYSVGLFPPSDIATGPEQSRSAGLVPSIKKTLAIELERLCGWYNDAHDVK